MIRVVLNTKYGPTFTIDNVVHLNGINLSLNINLPYLICLTLALEGCHINAHASPAPELITPPQSMYVQEICKAAMSVIMRSMSGQS